MRIVGKILWWNDRDGFGVIEDASGKEYYFDISVIEGRKTTNLKPGIVIQFQINSSIANPACAKSVVVPPAKSKYKSKIKTRNVK